eukprot:13734425-Ditylum_brightwellii.AAC.1
MPAKLESVESRRHLQIEVNECSDATNFFISQNTNGVNVLDTYFDCKCSGDLKSYFAMVCSLENHCSIDDESGLEVCVNIERTYEFSVSDGVIERYEKGNSCIEYLKNGPRAGPLCFTHAALCPSTLREEHQLTVESS